MKKSQKERVIKRLLEFGLISRNACLQNYISRLSAIIQVLESEGWRFRTEREGGDYLYIVVHTPYRKTEYINPITGQIITRYLTTS